MGYSHIVSTLDGLVLRAGLKKTRVNFNTELKPHAGLNSVSMTVPLEGNYSNIVSFIRELENSETFFLITAISLESSQPNGQVSNVIASNNSGDSRECGPLAGHGDLLLPMITSDKKKAALLGLLVVMAVLSWYFVMRPGMATATVGPATKPPGATKPIKLGPATIDLALLKEQSTNDVGQKNIFAFRQKPVPKPTPSVVAAANFYSSHSSAFVECSAAPAAPAALQVV